MESYKLQIDKNSCIKFVAGITLIGPLIIIMTLMLTGRTEELSIDLQLLSWVVSFCLLLSLGSIFFHRPKITLTSKGIMKPGFNQYSYKDIIPWTNIRQHKVETSKGLSTLHLDVEYPRNFFSKNGSKEIDIANIFFHVSHTKHSGDELLELIAGFQKA